MELHHLDQERLARRWAISPRTLESWRSLGKGPPFMRLGGRVAYRLQDIEAFEQSQLRTPLPPNRPRQKR